MLEQTGNPIRFYAAFLKNKIGHTGLSVTVDVMRGSNGSLLVTGGAAVELGGGVYAYTLSAVSVSSEDEYIAKFITADTTTDQRHTWALWAVGKAGVENSDATISSRLRAVDYIAPPNTGAIAIAVENQLANEFAAIPTNVGLRTVGATPPGNSADALLRAAGGAADPLMNPVPGNYPAGSAGEALGDVRTLRARGVTLINPITEALELILVRGDTYTIASGREDLPEWSSPEWSPLGLTSAPAITFKASRTSGGAVVLSLPVTALSATRIQLELDSDDTSHLSPLSGGYSYDIQLTQTGGAIITLVRGKMTILSDVR